MSTMSFTEADRIVSDYRNGRFAECVSQMGDDEFEKYQTALRATFFPWWVSAPELILSNLKAGLIPATIMFVGYCLLFVLFFQKPVIVGLVASLVVELLMSMTFLATDIRYRIEKSHFRDVRLDDLDGTGLTDALRQASQAHQGVHSLAIVEAEVIRWLEYMERQYAEIGRLTDTVYADGEKTRERLHAVADLEHIATRQVVVDAFAELERRAKRIQEIEGNADKQRQETFYGDERLRIYMTVGRTLRPTGDLLDLLDEADYTRLVLEMADRGIPTSCKDGDEGYDEAKGIVDSIYGERLKTAADSVIYKFPADFDMLGHLARWEASEGDDEKTGGKTDEETDE